MKFWRLGARSGTVSQPRPSLDQRCARQSGGCQVQPPKKKPGMRPGLRPATKGGRTVAPPEHEFYWGSRPGQDCALRDGWRARPEPAVCHSASMPHSKTFSDEVGPCWYCVHYAGPCWGDPYLADCRRDPKAPSCVANASHGCAFYVREIGVDDEYMAARAQGLAVARTRRAAHRGEAMRSRAGGHQPAVLSAATSRPSPDPSIRSTGPPSHTRGHQRSSEGSHLKCDPLRRPVGVVNGDELRASGCCRRRVSSCYTPPTEKTSGSPSASPSSKGRCREVAPVTRALPRSYPAALDLSISH